jgi:ABC-type transporter Mla subunit MlaD
MEGAKMNFHGFAILVLAAAVVYGVIKIGPQIAAAERLIAMAESQISKAEEDLSKAEKDINGIQGDMDKITTALQPLTAVGQFFQDLQKKGYILDPSRALPDINKITSDLSKLAPDLNKQVSDLAKLAAQIGPPVSQLNDLVKTLPGSKSGRNRLCPPAPAPCPK